ALACLLVDVAARWASGGTRTLEGAFRAVLAQGGNASDVWSLERVVKVMDQAMGAPILPRMDEEHGQHAGAFELDRLAEELVARLGADEVALEARARLSSLRKAIEFGAARAQ